MNKKTSLKIIALLLVCLCVFVACNNDDENLTDWKQELPQMAEYTLTDGPGEHVANIPFDKYISQATDFGDKVVLNATDFGASPEASAQQNQKAINEGLVEAGKQNGVLKVEGGVFKTGTVYMQSNATLYIAKDSSLKLPDYDDLTGDEKRIYLDDALIKAVEVDNWRITGPGTLDGNGNSYTVEPANAEKKLSS